ncbi:MAG: hypothetical protein PHS73_02295 [Candidatus Peribacteraceae bacterium]|nr:hypothetical protein [Candidatus Peribacteraceae bacterium]
MENVLSLFSPSSMEEVQEAARIMFEETPHAVELLARKRNDTYKVTGQRQTNVVQMMRIPEDIDAVQHNLALFEEAQEKANLPPYWQKLHFRWYKGPDGIIWKGMNYLPVRTYEAVQDSLQVREALEIFHTMLSTVTGWKTLAPAYHDTVQHLKQLREAVKGQSERVIRAMRIIENNAHMAEPEQRHCMSHNDCKPDVFAWSRGRIVALLDLDLLQVGEHSEDINRALQGKRSQYEYAVRLLLDYCTGGHYFKHRTRRPPDYDLQRVEKICAIFTL